MQTGDILQDTTTDSEKESIFIVNKDLQTADDYQGESFTYPITKFKEKYNKSIILREDLRNKYFKGR